MGLLNNSQIVVDAVLTRKGREYLATNDPKFKITKFALSDDGVDYSLYDPDHTSGSAYYGENIKICLILSNFRRITNNEIQINNIAQRNT